jgi:hypothetical protein
MPRSGTHRAGRYARYESFGAARSNLMALPGGDGFERIVADEPDFLKRHAMGA